MTNNNNN